MAPSVTWVREKKLADVFQLNCMQRSPGRFQWPLMNHTNTSTLTPLDVNGNRNKPPQLTMKSQSPSAGVFTAKSKRIAGPLFFVCLLSFRCNSWSQEMMKNDVLEKHRLLLNRVLFVPVKQNLSEEVQKLGQDSQSTPSAIFHSPSVLN